jgi:membrane glycosyltransferase
MSTSTSTSPVAGSARSAGAAKPQTAASASPSRGPEAAPPSGVATVPRAVRRWRIFGLYSAAVLLTGLVSLLFADLLWRGGWTASSTVLLALFVILFLLTAIGCMHALWGFGLRLLGDPCRLTLLADFRSRSIAGTSTAIVVPIFNEEVTRVYEGLRATYQSLARTGQLAQFDFFILSDSNAPEKWVEEERRWSDLVRELEALGRIHYRRRVLNQGKKSGNVRDFLKAWGRSYRYFIVLDADSLMRGETLVDLVKLMETHPAVGLIQTVPALVNAESLFGRMQQFANRLYAPIFITGLNFWTQGSANYWGHNAIIRTEPFMEYCDLPELPGAKPFGGHILSHDFVEAALLRKANWQVWFAHDLEGSYEEGPPDMLTNAQRDRRWCQGNLQHGMVLWARGLKGASRLHLLLGIFGYLASPLWLLFLLTFNVALWFKGQTGLSDFVVRPWTPFLNLTGTEHALLIFVLCLGVLFLPKVLALLDLARDPVRSRTFGGLRKALASAVLETLFSALHAPLQMLWHSKFVATILLGVGVKWGPQPRGADGITWRAALRQHWVQTLLGLGWGAFVWHLDPQTFWWFAPVMAGLVVSIPLSVWTSRASWGVGARRLGLFVTPEETAPPSELAGLRARMGGAAQTPEAVLCASSGLSPSVSGLAQAVLDPYINAIHVSLLREKRLNPEYSAALIRLGVGTPVIRTLGEKLLAQGPEALQPEEKLLLLSDADAMSWLHRQAWLRPSEGLASWWQNAIRNYCR